MLSRFRRERKILAQLNHPNIARLLDGGTTESGLPYLVMDYVDGSTVDEYCDSKRLSTIERLKLFQTICSAVHYAHQNLVIHRDIKARNILVTAEGSAKLLDFGIAKVIQPEPLPAYANTATALPIMKPEYASPEQIRGETVTTATDIYSLGVVLYELLTGHRPYRIEIFTDFQKVLSQEQPSKPSSMVLRIEEITTEGGPIRILPQEVAEARSESLSKLKNRLDGDLDNIVLKALNKVPNRRYASVEQFSEDIGRYLQGLPVSARKDSLRYRAGKFINRNKAGVAAAALVLLTLISALVVSLWQAGVARRERDAAHQQKIKAERISEFLAAALDYSDPTSAVPGGKNRRDATISEMLDDLAPRIQSELGDQLDVRASLQRTIGVAYLSQTRVTEAAR
jgi:eukaryotic-like serine/threonine-protein kinase